MLSQSRPDGRRFEVALSPWHSALTRLSFPHGRGFALMRMVAHVLAFLWSRRLFLGRFGLPDRSGVTGVGVFALLVVSAVKARKFAKGGGGLE